MSTRLRKTFHYPADEPANDSPDELDEEEQEELIADLTTRDQSNTLFYRRAFVALPLVAALIYIPVFFAGSFRHVLLALLSLSSLGSTAYILLLLPPRNATPPSALAVDGRGPLDKALPVLNAALSAVLAFAALLAWRRDLTDEAWRGFLPGGASSILSYTLHPFAHVICSHLPHHHVRSLSDGSSRCGKPRTSQVQLQRCLIFLSFPLPNTSCLFSCL